MSTSRPIHFSTTMQRCRAAVLVAFAAIAGCGAPGVNAQTLDAGFTASFSDTVEAVVVQPNGTIVAGGAFQTVNGQSRYGLARLTSTGALDAAFPSGPNAPVLALAVQADGRIVVGGRFATMGGVASRRIARLLADGSLDTSFVSQIDNNSLSEVTHVAVQADGKIVIAGRFSTISGQSRDRLARLNANGSLDTNFNTPTINTAVSAMALGSDGRVLVHGSYSNLNPSCGPACVIRLQADGSFDTSFVITSVSGPAEHLSVQSNGRILISGAFGALGTHPTYFVGRLLASGAADTSFANTELRSSTIERIVEQADGRFLIAGQVRWGTAGGTETRLARLGSNGARDTSFSEPQFDSLLNALALQPDQSILVGGLFTSANGIARNRLARFSGPRPDPVYSNGFD